MPWFLDDFASIFNPLMYVVLLVFFGIMASGVLWSKGEELLDRFRRPLTPRELADKRERELRQQAIRKRDWPH